MKGFIFDRLGVVALSAAIVWMPLRVGAVCTLPSFLPVSSATGSFDPTAVAVGDFDGDGHLDAAVANYDGQKVSVVLGDGTGGFGAPTQFASAFVFYTSVAVGDFNADAKPDLAVGDWAGTIWVMLGDGTGGFGAPASFPTGNTAYSIVVADFNGDGKLDLAAGGGFGGTLVAILLGDGTGSFAAPTTFASGVPGGLAVGDFNNDAKLDIAVGGSGAMQVAVLLGDGLGGLSAPTLFSNGVDAGALATGDFNADGKLDVAVAPYYPTTPIVLQLSVLLGDGAGGLGVPTNYSFGGLLSAASSFNVVAGDFDGDAKLDLAVSGYSSLGTIVSVLLGDGVGGFGVPTNFALGEFRIGDPYAALSNGVVGDFNGDGRLDIAAAAYRPQAINGGGSYVSLLLSSCLGSVPPNTQLATCENTVNMNLSRFVSCLAKCHRKLVLARTKGNSFDVGACEGAPRQGRRGSCRANYNTASARLVARGICPSCLDARAMTQRADAAQASVAQQSSPLYCAL